LLNSIFFSEYLVRVGTLPCVQLANDNILIIATENNKYFMTNIFSNLAIIPGQLKSFTPIALFP
jgi:hypothetical protein